MNRDTWTRTARRLARWICSTPTCGAVNPDITSTCIRCGS